MTETNINISAILFSAGVKVMVACEFCKKEFWKFRREYNLKNNFCSHGCRAKFLNPKLLTKPRLKCLNCEILIKNRESIYCSAMCHKAHVLKIYLEDWKSGKISGNSKNSCSTTIRKYLFSKYNNACAICKWSEINKATGKVPLEVDHIDGNYQNNKEENLNLLCPNCHSLTCNYRGLNKGNGRKHRYNKEHPASTLDSGDPGRS